MEAPSRREYPGSPSFPIDKEFLQHLDEDLNSPTPATTREEQKERQLRRLGAAGKEWVWASTAWFDDMPEERKVEMKILLGGEVGFGPSS